MVLEPIDGYWSQSMDVQPIPGHQLTAQHCQRWERIRFHQPALGSPYLSAAFTRAAAAVRNDIEVAILKQDGEILGFFPFQRAAHGVGLPVAAGVNDFHGPVTAPQLRWTADELLAGCGLHCWRFNHLLVGIAPLQPHHELVGTSPYIELGQRFDGYLETLRRTGSRAGKKLAAQARRLAREVGPLHFVAAARDPALLALLCRWKSQQLGTRGKSHRLGRPWVRALLERLQQVDTATLAGALSALWAGEHLVALHMGLRARTPGRGAWHYWLPAYDPAFSRYSPGLVLLLHIVRCAAAMGLGRVDLGRGTADYKRRLMTGCAAVAEGVARLAEKDMPKDRQAA